MNDKHESKVSANRRKKLLLVFGLLVLASVGAALFFFLTRNAEPSADELYEELIAGPEAEELLSTDRGLVKGTLDNGLTYYIDENNRPGAKAQLLLAVNAGSAQETQEQGGAAHYLEHMMFNGTEKYPERELIKTLESFGTEFGPDVNAYTSFDETVYLLDIPNTEDSLEQGFDVLHQWATAATIDKSEVEKERNVILSEWRLRTQNTNGRYYKKLLESVFADTAYAQSPISTKEQIETITSKQLRDFYEKWYTADNMALIVVGEVDASEIESQIKQTFDDLVGSRESERSGYKHPDKNSFLQIVDSEVAEPFVEINFLTQPDVIDTEGELKIELAQQIILSTLQERLKFDAQKSDNSFYQAETAVNGAARNLTMQGALVYAPQDKLAAAGEAMFAEIRRIEKFGITEEELSFATNVFLERAEIEYDKRSTRQNYQLAQQYVSNFLAGSSMEDPRKKVRLRRRLTDEIDVEYISKVIQYNSKTQNLLAIASGKDETTPTAEALEKAWEQSSSIEIEERKDAVEEIDVLLDDPPVQQQAVRTSARPWPAIRLTFDNGITVLYSNNVITENRIAFQSYIPGGLDTAGTDQFVAASLSPSVINKSGVQEYSSVALKKYKEDKSVAVSSFISPTHSGFVGEATQDDLEVALQLLHIYMTEPQVDDSALRQVVTERVAELPSENNTADNALYETENRLLKQDLGWDYSPPPEEVQALTKEEILETYTKSFSPTEGTVFAFTGDVDPETFEALATKWLGTIPPQATAQENTKASLTIGDGSTTLVTAGSDAEQGTLRRIYISPRTEQTSSRVYLDALEQVLTLRLTETIREELGFTYSPIVQAGTFGEPFEQNQIHIEISGDPQNHTQLAEALEEEIADLRDNGPTNEEFSAVKEQLQQRYSFTTNEEEAQQFIYFQNQSGLGYEPWREVQIKELSENTLQQYFQQALPADKHFDIQQVPLD